MKGMYCMYDKVARQWLAPFVATTDGASVRMVDQSFKGAKVDPHDFVLYKLSLWDDQADSPIVDPKTSFVCVKDYSEGQQTLAFGDDHDSD